MNDLKIFENPSFGQVRTMLREGEPWFVAADVCRVLDISNPTDALRRLDDDERARFNLGRQGEANIINEPGLYSLVLGSRKPEARAFKRWVTHEVLPAIRMYGGYVTPQGIEALMMRPEMLDRMAKAIVRRERPERRPYQLEPAKSREDIRRVVAELVNSDAVIYRCGDMVMLNRFRVYEEMAGLGYGLHQSLRALDEVYPLRCDACGNLTVLKHTPGGNIRVVALILKERRNDNGL